MKKGTPVFLKSNPSAGTVRIRFIGYNLSPRGAPPFIQGTKIVQTFQIVNALNEESFISLRERRPPADSGYALMSVRFKTYESFFAEMLINVKSSFIFVEIPN